MIIRLKLLEVLINNYENDNTKKKREQYSPILFTTTLRSPERCKYLLKIIQKI